MKKVLLILISVITLFTCSANNSPGTWVFNNFRSSEKDFIYSGSGTDEVGNYEEYWCTCSIMTSGLEVRRHEEPYGQNDTHYYLTSNGLDSVNRANQIPLESNYVQVQFNTWYSIFNSTKYKHVNWDNFEVFRKSKYSEVCVSMRIYKIGEKSLTYYDNCRREFATIAIPIYNVRIIINGDKTTSVETIITDEQPIEYYNLNGIKIENPEHGIFIKKQGDKLNKIIL